MNSQPTNRSPESEPSKYFQRRRFLALSASVGTALFAGCASETEQGPADGSSPTSGGSDGTAPNSGTFRLLISDQPVAIEDFDELNVSFDRARIFRGEGTDDDEAEATDTPTGTTTSSETGTATETTTATATGTETATATSSATPTNTATETAAQTEDDDSEDGDETGFFVIDLDGATVDLTQVVGDKAIGVFDGELPEGRYTKIELYAADVGGIVDGDPVDVMIPSGKLQIVKPFEVVAGETLSFVFDINVVKKGRTGEYNLLPVISESGVAGKDVEVNEVGNGNSDSSSEDDSEATETEEVEEEDENDGGQGQGPPDDAGDDES